MILFGKIFQTKYLESLPKSGYGEELRQAHDELANNQTARSMHGVKASALA